MATRGRAVRTVSGQVVLPPNAPARKAGLVLIQVQDASRQDAAAEVVAEKTLENVALEPGGRIAFRLAVPEVAQGRTLLFRVHVDLGGSGRVASGDLLTTAAYTLPATGPVEAVQVKVAVV